MNGMGPGAKLLPREGGYFDQPAALMDAFQMFDTWMAERQRSEG